MITPIEDISDIIYPHLKYRERVIWEGRPAKGFSWRIGGIIAMVLGAVFSLFSVATIPVFDGMVFGGLFFYIGVLLFIGGFFTGWVVRRLSRYALTNQRAFILFKHPISGMRVHSWPITWDTYVEKPKSLPASLLFAVTDKVQINNSPMRIGFARIDDADVVYDLIQKIREESR